jgi:hypothetical protein
LPRVAAMAQYSFHLLGNGHFHPMFAGQTHHLSRSSYAFDHLSYFSLRLLRGVTATNS